MKEEMDNEQLEILLCSANSSTDVGDYKFVVASIHATMVFFFSMGFWNQIWWEMEGLVDVGFNLGF